MIIDGRLIKRITRSARTRQKGSPYLVEDGHRDGRKAKRSELSIPVRRHIPGTERFNARPPAGSQRLAPGMRG
jgi:hypothetical protein